MATHGPTTPRHQHSTAQARITYTKLIQQFPLFQVQIMQRINKKVQVGKDQEKAQSEKDSHSKNRGGKKPN